MSVWVIVCIYTHESSQSAAAAYLENAAECALADISNINNVISRVFQLFQLRVELSICVVIIGILGQFVQIYGRLL